MIPVITLNKEFNDELDLYERWIQIYCLVNNIPLSYGDSRMLAYYIKHGTNKESENMLFEECRYASKQSIFNIKKSLIEKKLISKDRNNEVVVDGKLIHEISNVTAVKLNLYTRDFIKQVREDNKESS